MKASQSVQFIQLDNHSNRWERKVFTVLRPSQHKQPVTELRESTLTLFQIFKWSLGGEKIENYFFLSLAKKKDKGNEEWN